MGVIDWLFVIYTKNSNVHPSQNILCLNLSPANMFTKIVLMSDLIEF